MIKIFSNVILWVLFAITSGILVSHFYAATGMAIQPSGSFIIEVIKLFIPPIILLTIVSGISGNESLNEVGMDGNTWSVYTIRSSEINTIYQSAHYNRNR
jgi:aerobic C4-dicarboxylate transport protein